MATSVCHNNTVCSHVRKKIAAFVLKSSDSSLQTAVLQLQPADISPAFFVLFKTTYRVKYEVLEYYNRLISKYFWLLFQNKTN